MPEWLKFHHIHKFSGGGGGSLTVWTLYLNCLGIASNGSPVQGCEAVLPSEVDMCSTRQERHDALHVAVAATHQTKWGI